MYIQACFFGNRFEIRRYSNRRDNESNNLLLLWFFVEGVYCNWIWLVHIVDVSWDGMKPQLACQGFIVRRLNLYICVKWWWLCLCWLIFLFDTSRQRGWIMIIVFSLKTMQKFGNVFFNFDAFKCKEV